ncbi:hypothetical protein ACS0TY_005960 [Phlomoides rotata]
MTESCFTRILLLCLLLLLFSNNGFGRDLPVHKDHIHSIAAAFYQGKSREAFELDYADAGPNFNGRSALPYPSVPPPPPPAAPPSETGY